MYDKGLDSRADLRIFERVLIAGLVAVVIAGFLAFIFTGIWWLLLVTIGPYALIAASQWAFALRRGKRTEAEIKAELDHNER